MKIFLEINKDSINKPTGEPCIKAVAQALKDHNENCKVANAKNKDQVVADFLIKEWANLTNDYKRVLKYMKVTTQSHSRMERIKGVFRRP